MGQAGGERVDFRCLKAWMGLESGLEWSFDPQVEFQRAKREPAAAPPPERVGFFKLHKADQASPEGPGGLFAVFGDGKLDMIKCQDHGEKGS